MEGFPVLPLNNINFLYFITGSRSLYMTQQQSKSQFNSYATMLTVYQSGTLRYYLSKSVPTAILAAPKNVFYTQTLQNSQCFNRVTSISHYTIQQNVFCGKSNSDVTVLGGTFCSTTFSTKTLFVCITRFVLYCSLYLLSQRVRESGSSMLTYRLLVRQDL